MGVTWLVRGVYAGAAWLVRAAADVAPAGEGKVLRAFRERRGIRARYERWGRSGRRAERALLWMHAPSVGEGLQARPVLERLRAGHPELQLAYTYFSPSAVSFARGLDVDFRDYLPFDTSGDTGVALAALRPSALVFSKLDVWPTLVRQAERRRVPVGMISATLTAGSGRRGWLAAAVLRDAYARLAAVGVIDDADAARLIALGVREQVITITGDTRYDQVWARARGVDHGSPLLASLRSRRPTLVAGSTWPPDERVLLDAWRSFLSAHADARLIIAPHEPSAGHLASIDRWARATGVVVARLGAPEVGAAGVVLVDRVGALGDLYALADVAFVGGGFHAAGLHSVLEPAAFGVPVLVGPRYHSSRDAVRLLGAGGGAVARDAGELLAQLEHWWSDTVSRRDAGVRARDVVRLGLGAADRSAALVEHLLAVRPG